MLGAFVLSQLAALPDALIALWLKLLGDGVLQANRRLLLLAALGLGLSATLTWFLTTLSTRVQRRFRDKVTIALEAHVAKVLASIATIAHQERPDYLDRLSVLRNQIFVLDHMYMSVFSTCGWILRLGVTIALLVQVHPALLLLALFALPTVFTSTWRPDVERKAEERRASSARLATHLFTTATTARARQGGARHPHRPAARGRPAPGVGVVVRPGRGGALVERALARARLGGLRLGVRRRDRVRLVVPEGARRGRAAGARRGRTALGLRRGDRGRDRLPARDLDGRIAAAGVARGLRGVARGLGRPARAFPRGRGHPARGRVVRLSGHRSPGARLGVALAPRRRGGGARRRERSRQDDARQAALQALRADRRPDPRGRRGARPRARRRVARARGGRVPGLLPLRASRAPVGRRRRRAARGRRAGGRGRGRARGRLGRGRAAARRSRDPARPDLAGRRRGVVRAVAEARARARLHARAAAAAGARRADRGARRRDRARAVRALRRGGARRGAH